jgi:transcriptional regulator with XRE-family HTH domain
MDALKLREKLESTRVNLSKLARLSGVSIRTLRRIRHGQHLPQQGTIAKIEPHLKGARS